MATLEDEIKDLKEKNNELAQKVQYWKMTAADRENEKLNLMKEMNELRLKYSRLKNSCGYEARKLDSALQAASEKAISHLVMASSEIANSMEIAKAYMRDRQETEAQSPRWSTLGGTPTAEKTEKVHRVPPMMMGGQSIQPVVALSRTVLNTSNPATASRSPTQNHSMTERAVPIHMLQATASRSPTQNRSMTERVVPMHMLQGTTPRSPTPNRSMAERVVPMHMLQASASRSPTQNRSMTERVAPMHMLQATASRSPPQNRSMTERAVPMHMLQDVYIPLTRIDISDLPNNHMETDTEANNTYDSSSTDDSELEDSEERIDESANISDKEDEYSGRKLHALSEEDSEIEEDETPRLTLHLDNPLEGPSWLLDSPPDTRLNQTRSRANLEPDSTTEPDNTPKTRSAKKMDDNAQAGGGGSGMSVRVSCAFSPTVRRRKRTSAASPPPATPRQHERYSPRPPSARKNTTNGRVLKVLVAKMRLGPDGESAISPPKRARSPRDPLLTFDAPSPNGATDSAVIVSEARGQRNHEIDGELGSPRSLQITLNARRSRLNSHDSMTTHPRLSVESRISHTEHSQETHGQQSKPYEDDSRRTTQDSVVKGRSRLGSVDSRDSDSGSGGQGDSLSEGRTRRPRKMVTYKEKPLNRKLRR